MPLDTLSFTFDTQLVFWQGYMHATTSPSPSRLSAPWGQPGTFHSYVFPLPSPPAPGPAHTHKILSETDSVAEDKMFWASVLL